MKRQKSMPPAVANGSRIKLRINYRTTIIVRSMQAVQMWLTKFPDAKIVP